MLHLKSLKQHLTNNERENIGLKNHCNEAKRSKFYRVRVYHVLTSNNVQLSTIILIRDFSVE